jgi:hypothetical protein
MQQNPCCRSKSTATAHSVPFDVADLVGRGNLNFQSKQFICMSIFELFVVVECRLEYQEDGATRVEDQTRPWGLGRSNWLFAGALRSGKRAVAIMRLTQSARMNGHDPYPDLEDALTWGPTQRAGEIGQLLPQHWVPV